MNCPVEAAVEGASPRAASAGASFVAAIMGACLRPLADERFPSGVQFPLGVAGAGPGIPEKAADEPPAGRDPAEKSAARRVLVVDDNLDAAESLAMLLEMDGHETALAHDGRRALEMAESFRPAVILLDIGLPLLDGYQVAQRIRARDWGRNIKLIAVTGWGKEEDRALAEAAGFDHHLTKPINPAALASLL